MEETQEEHLVFREQDETGQEKVWWVGFDKLKAELFKSEVARGYLR